VAFSLQITGRSQGEQRTVQLKSNAEQNINKNGRFVDLNDSYSLPKTNLNIITEKLTLMLKMRMDGFDCAFYEILRQLNVLIVAKTDT